MSGYIRGLILIVIVCNLVLYLAPDFGVGMKKYIIYLCGLTVLLTVLAPLSKGCERQADVRDKIISFFDVQESGEKDIRKAVIGGTVRETAYAVMMYLTETYGIRSDRVSVAVITDEAEEQAEVTELQIYIENCAPSDRERIRREVSDMINASVYVFGKADD